MADIIKNPIQQLLAESKATLPDHLREAKPVVSIPSASKPTPDIGSKKQNGGNVQLRHGDRKQVFAFEADEPGEFLVTMSQDCVFWPSNIAAVASPPAFVVEVPTYRLSAAASPIAPVYGLVNYGIGAYNSFAMVDFNGSFSVVANRIKLDAIFPEITPPLALPSVGDVINATGYVGKCSGSSFARCSVVYHLGGFIGQSRLLPILPKTRRLKILRTFSPMGLPLDDVVEITVIGTNTGSIMYESIRLGVEEPCPWIEVPTIPCALLVTDLDDPAPWVPVGAIVTIIYEMGL